MKKLIVSVFTLVAMSFMACGPSAEEKAAAEKAIQDSIANVEMAQKATEDSLAAAMQKALDDSITAARQKALEDSIAMLKGDVKKMKQKESDTKKKEEKKEEDKKTQKNEKG